MSQNLKPSKTRGSTVQGIESSTASSPKRKSTISSQQAKRFIDAAREAGCSEDEAEIRENMKRIAKARPKPDAKNDG